MSVCVCVSVSVRGYVHGGQEKASDPLEVELQALVCCEMCVLPDVHAGIRTMVSLQGF